MRECQYCGQQFINKNEYKIHKCRKTAKTPYRNSPDSMNEYEIQRMHVNMNNPNTAQAQLQKQISTYENHIVELNQYIENIQQEYDNNIQIISQKCQTYVRQNEDLRYREQLTSTENQNLKLQIQQNAYIQVSDESEKQQHKQLIEIHSKLSQEHAQLKKDYSQLIETTTQQQLQQKKYNEQKLSDQQKQFEHEKSQQEHKIREEIKVEVEKTQKQHRETVSNLNQQYQESVSKLNQELTIIKQQFDKLSHKHNELLKNNELQLQQLNKTLHEEKQNHMYTKKEFNNWKEQHQTLITSQQQSFDVLLNSKQQEVHSFQKLYKETKQNLISLDEKYATLSSESESLKNNYNTNIDKAKQTIQTLKKNVEQIKEDTQKYKQQLDIDFKQKQENYEKLINDLSKKAEQLVSAEQRITQTNKLYTELTQRHEQLANTHKSIDKEYRELKLKTSTSEQTIDRQLQELKAAKNKLATLLLQYKNAKDAEKLLEDKLKTKSQQNKEWSERYKLLQDQQQRFENQSKQQHSDDAKCLDNLQTELQISQATVVKLNKRLDYFYEQEREWINKDKKYKDLIADYNKIKQNLTNQIDELTKLQIQFTEQTQELTKLYASRQSLFEKYTETKQQLQEITTKNKSLENEIQTLKEQFTNTIKTKDKLVEDNAVLEAKVNEQTVSCKNKTNEIQMLSTHLHKIKEQLQQEIESNKLTKDAKQSLEVKTELLTQQLTHQKQQNQDYKNECNTLKENHSKNLKLLESSLQKEKNKYITLHEKYETILNQNEKYKKTLEKYDSSLETIKELKQQLIDSHSAFKNQYNEKIREFDEYKSQVKTNEKLLNDKFTRFTKDIESYEKNLQALKQTIIDKQNNLSQVENYLQKREADYKVLEETLLIQKEQLQQELHNYNNKLKQLKIIPALKNEINEYKLKLEEKDKSYNDICNHQQTLEETIRNQQETVNICREEIIKHKGIIERWEIENQKLKDDIHNLKEKPKILNTKMQKFRDESLREIHKHLKAKNEKQLEVDKLTTLTKELNQTIISMNSEIDQLKSDLEHVIQMKDDLRDQFTNHLNDQKGTQDTLINDLKETLKLREHRIKDLEYQFTKFVEKQLNNVNING